MRSGASYFEGPAYWSCTELLDLSRERLELSLEFSMGYIFLFLLVIVPKLHRAPHLSSVPRPRSLVGWLHQLT